MLEYFNETRSFLVAVMSIILSYFAPITDIVFVIAFLFILNMLVGLVAGIAVDNEKFDLKKFFHCIVETFLVYVIILAVFTLGEKMHNLPGALQCIGGVVYACIYFYGTNILRNIKKLAPKSKTIAFIYYVVSFEIVKKIPYLQAFNSQTNEKRRN